MPKSSRLKNVLVDIPPNSDVRGEAVKIMTVKSTGWVVRDVIAISTKPGASRAGHYHKHKEEVFVVLNGNMEAELVDIETKEHIKVKLDGKHRQMLFIRPYVTHTMKNVGNETAWFVEIQNTDYDPNDDYKYVS